MARLRQTLLLVLLSLLLINEAHTQTSIYATVGIGKTEIKKFETLNVHLGMLYNPELFKQYEVGVIQEFSKGFSAKLGGGLANYACVISIPNELQEGIPDYRDTHVDLYYISVPVSILYNPIFNLRMEVGVVNNFFNLLSVDGPSVSFSNIKTYNLIPYWGGSYTFLNIIEVGYVNHIYLSNFSVYTNWYEQENEIEPSVFFKYNVWYVYASFKFRLKKRDE